MLIRPPCDFGDQPVWDFLLIGKLNRAFRRLVSRQAVGKGFNHLRSWIDSKMCLLCRKVDDIPLLPVCWHAPGDLLMAVRKCLTQNSPGSYQDWLYFFRLFSNILIYVFWRSATVMLLVFITKCSSASGALPHGSDLLLIVSGF